MKRSSMKKSLGFTMIELLVVMSIVAVLGMLGIPFARGVIIEGKVEPTAKDLQTAAAKIRTNNAGNGATPYTGVNTAVFANTGRGLFSTLTVAGAGATATVSHDIGATASSVTVVPGNITVLNDSFDVILPTVNEAACPGLATQLSKAAERITINGTVVKAPGGIYNGSIAQNACTAGDTNTYIFAFR